jgi:hypothetical protein
MSPHDVREFVRARPFVPFRIHTSEGRAYDVRHPDEAMVLTTRVVLPVRTKANGDFAESLEHVALAHVVRIEEMNAEARQSTN